MNLIEYQDKKYRDFTSKLCETKYEILGVRLPILRNLAKKLTIDEIRDLTYFEDYMLYGFVIGNEKNIKKVFKELDYLVPKIDNWSLCDSLVTSLKITNEYKNEMLNYILKYQNKSIFEKRFLIVMLLKYYIKSDINILDIVREIKSGDYYVDMAISWLLAEALIYYPSKIIKYISEEKNNFIVNKTISKARESYRIDDKLKKELLNFKR